MMQMLATFMIHPLQLERWQQMLLLLPLCLCVSVVYKTTRCARLRDIPLASLVLWVTIVVGMYAVGAALLLIYELVA